MKDYFGGILAGIIVLAILATVVLVSIFAPDKPTPVTVELGPATQCVRLVPSGYWCGSTEARVMRDLRTAGTHCRITWVERNAYGELEVIGRDCK